MECFNNQSIEDPKALLSLVQSQHQTLLHQSERIEELESQLAWFKRQIFGQKSERYVNPNQVDMFADLLTKEEPLPEEKTEQITTVRRKPKRNPLPKTLARERIELDVQEKDKACPCCKEPRRRIGETITEELAFQPAKFWVREYIRAKYACPHCEEGGVVTAPAPVRPIPKGIFGHEVLAHLLVSKYEDHLPLHRQLKIFRRQNIELSESTVNDGVLQSAQLLAPLTDVLKTQLLCAQRIFTDDTPVTLKSNAPNESHQSRLWVYIRQGEEDPPVTLFHFTENRSRAGPQNILGEFEGFLQADAYGGYDALYATQRIVEVGCWSHARRYFDRAGKLHKKSSRAHEALGYIRKLFMIERDIKTLSHQQRFWIRRQRALPVLRAFKTWLDQQHIDVSTKTKFGIAVTYTLNQWEALVEYVNHGLLEISNDTAERAIRPIAVGRKNWMYFGSPRGGHAAAVIFSLMATCKQNSVNPFDWLVYVLKKLPTTNASDYPSLLPFHFKDKFPL